MNPILIDSMPEPSNVEKLRHSMGAYCVEYQVIRSAMMCVSIPIF